MFSVEATVAVQKYNKPLLPAELDPLKLPKHVAIVMDGNYRWAKSRGALGDEQLKVAAQGCYSNCDRIVKLSSDWGIKYLTVYAFSTENFNRPQDEVQCWMENIERFISPTQPSNVLRHGIQFNCIGDIPRLPPSLQNTIATAHKLTKNNRNMKLTMAIGYSGRADIVKACRGIARKVKSGKLDVEDIDENKFSEELMHGRQGTSSPDLFIRTAGDIRLSNFMLWQLAYTELVFEEKFWPEFGEEQYKKALLEFQNRKRTFGSTHNA